MAVAEGIEVAAQDTVLGGAVASLAERIGAVARGTGRRWTGDDGVVAAELGRTRWSNLGVATRPPTEATWDAVDALFADDQEFVLFVPWATPDLRSRGWSLMGHPPFMVRPSSLSTPLPPVGFRITEVSGAEQATVFERTLETAYPMPEVTAWAGGNVPSCVRAFIGWEGDRPVATASATVHGGVNHVEMVSTMGDCRGRGYGEAITWAATQADPTLPAVLVASDPGRPIYERMGYLAVDRWTLWYR